MIRQKLLGGCELREIQISNSDQKNDNDFSSPLITCLNQHKKHTPRAYQTPATALFTFTGCAKEQVIIHLWDKEVNHQQIQLPPDDAQPDSIFQVVIISGILHWIVFDDQANGTLCENMKRKDEDCQKSPKEFFGDPAALLKFQMSLKTK